MKTKIHIIILLIILQSCNKTTSQKEIKKETILKKEVVVNTDSVKQDTVIKKNVIKQDTTTLKRNTELKVPPLSKTSGAKIIRYKGYLGVLADEYYGNKAYYLPLAAYNNLKNGYHLKQETVVSVPSFSVMVKLGIDVSHQNLDYILQARNLYIKHEKELWKTVHNRSLTKNQVQDLKNATLLINKSIVGLSKIENPPKKMIGQLKSVVKNLENLANGKSDGYGYDLDMVHQRLAHAFKNGMIWSREKQHP
jgi:hypothetical protein